MTEDYTYHYGTRGVKWVGSKTRRDKVIEKKRSTKQSENKKDVEESNIMSDVLKSHGNKKIPSEIMKLVEKGSLNDVKQTISLLDIEEYIKKTVNDDIRRYSEFGGPIAGAIAGVAYVRMLKKDANVVPDI